MKPSAIAQRSRPIALPMRGSPRCPYPTLYRTRAHVVPAVTHRTSGTFAAARVEGSSMRAWLLASCAAVTWACGGAGASPAAMTVPGGDPARGRLVVERYGCSGCHVIPGVEGPATRV